MSYLKSKTRTMKYDKESVELRKELQQLSKKSKGEFNTLEEANKAEFLLRNGMPVAKSKKGSEKMKDLLSAQANLSTKATGEPELSKREGLMNVDSTQSKIRKARVNAAKEGKVQSKKEELKTKPRLHEKGVVSIRPDNSDLKVVMQGRKVCKKVKDANGSKREEEKLDTKPDSADVFFPYRPLSPINIPTNAPAKFAIMGSQNTSMPVALTTRKNDEGRDLHSGSSFYNQGIEDDGFPFLWSSEASESRGTLPDDEERGKLQSTTVVDQDETGKQFEGTDFNFVYERSAKTKLGDGQTAKAVLSVSEEIQKKLQEMVSTRFSVVEQDVKNEVTSAVDTTEGNKLEGLVCQDAKSEETSFTTLEHPAGMISESKDVALTGSDTEKGKTVPLETEKKVKGDLSEGDICPDTSLDSSYLKDGELMKKKEEESKAVINVEESLKELSLPLKVTASDIVSVSGKKAQFAERPRTAPQNRCITVKFQSDERDDEVSFLSTWDSKNIPASPKTGETSPVKIHHFCSQGTTVELPAHLTRVSRDMHTLDRHRAVAERYHSPPETLPRVFSISEDLLRCCKHPELGEDWQVGVGDHGFERRLSEVAENILFNVANQTDTLENVQNAANRVFSGGDLEPLSIQGEKINLKDDSTRFYWTPAPPKLHLTPSFVRDRMFPAYQGAPVLKDTLDTEYGTTETVNEDSEDDEGNLDKMEPEDREARHSEIHGSYM